MNIYNRHVRFGLLLVITSAFINGPIISFGGIDLRIFDLSFIIFVLLSVPSLIRDTEFTVPKTPLFLFVICTYLFLAILIPLIGLVWYGYPVYYFIGDLRWLQVGYVGVVVLGVYNMNVGLFIKDMEQTVKLLIWIHLMMFMLQFLDYNNIVNTVAALDLWYYNQNPYGGNGYHIGRFAGAAVTSSGLGLSAAITIAILLRSSQIHVSRLIHLGIAFLLLVASGHRTSILAVVGMLFVFLIYHLSVGSISHAQVASGTLGLLPLGSILYIFDVGRIASSDRYSEIITVLFSPSSFAEVGGTRLGTWQTVLTATAREYPYGTLTNPAYVYPDVVIDSYIVLSYVQGKFVFLSMYIILLIIMAIYAIRLSFLDELGLTPIFFIGTISSFSITQNFITSIPGKLILILTVVVIWLLVLYKTTTSTTQL